MAESQPNGRPPWWRRHWLAMTVLGLMVLLAYAVLAVTVLPDRIVSLSGTKAGEDARLKAIVDTRGALLGVLAPVVVAIGAVAAFLNYRETAAQNRRTLELSRDSLDVTERGQLTERFTKAIEQLGQTAEEKLDIRLGGIYALEQIAKESKELHRPVMEILTAFIREHSPTLPDTAATLDGNQVSTTEEADHAPTEAKVPPLRADFQAISTVLGRREVSHDPDGFRLDLRGVALGMVDCRGAHLQGANFWKAQLQESYFEGAQLQKAYFGDAQLRNASFPHAQLQEAYFGDAQLQAAWFLDAQLQSANFADAQLQEAYFGDAQLKEAVFAGADLEGALFVYGVTDEHGALGLTPGQFEDALNVDKAVLPNYLIRALESKGVVRPAE